MPPPPFPSLSAPLHELRRHLSEAPLLPEVPTYLLLMDQMNFSGEGSGPWAVHEKSSLHRLSSQIINQATVHDEIWSVVSSVPMPSYNHSSTSLRQIPDTLLKFKAKILFSVLLEFHIASTQLIFSLYHIYRNIYYF